MRVFSLQSSAFSLAALLILLHVPYLFILNRNAAAELNIRTNTGEINIGSFYHGSKLVVEGLSDMGTELIVKITSPDRQALFHKKGRVGGLLWMNTGVLRVEHAPSLYFLYGTKKPEDILSPGEMKRYNIGYQSLKEHVDLSQTGNEEEKNSWFTELVKFKEDSGLYSISVEKITATAADGKQDYNIAIDWPYQAMPDNYTITVYAVRDKKILEMAETALLVQQTSIVKKLAGMADTNSAVYGIISILLALAVGFGVGIIFRKSAASH